MSIITTFPEVRWCIFFAVKSTIILSPYWVYFDLVTMSCLACLTGAWKWWAQERTGRASETRVSSRAHVLPYMLQAHVSQAPFHSYGVRHHLVNRARNDVFHKNKEKLFSICPAKYPRKSGKWPLQATPHPLARRAGLVPVDAQGVVTKSYWTVHQWHFRKSEASFPV